jgi:hypothetical protein
MSPSEINHFLVSFDPDTGKVDVRSYGTDYDAAQTAYAEAEQKNGIAGKLDIVLLGADSLETIKKTHSSYFRNGNAGLKELLEH